MTQEEHVREELTERIAGRLTVPRDVVSRMLAKDATLGEIWGDYLLCRETLVRFRAARSVGEARVAEYESHAASLEDEIVRRVQELRP